MSDPDVMVVPEQSARRAGRPSFTKALRRLRPTVFVAALLAVAALVSDVHVTPAPAAQPDSVHQSDHAIKLVQNQTPLFWWNGNRWDYFGFINAIRSSMNVHNNAVPGSSNTVDHTDPWNGGYLDVVIGTRDGHQVRIRLRRSDLYVVGWFDQNNTYQYIGPSDQADLPPNTNVHQALRTGSYAAMEAMANERGGHFSRYGARFNEGSVSASATALWKASNSNRDLQGQALLVLVQFISEAARFRGISDTIGWTGYGNKSEDNPQESTAPIASQIVDQETNWGQLSERFNWMLEANQNDSPNHAFWGFWRNSDGSVGSRLLITAADYALVFNLVKGYPGRRQ